MNLIIADDHTFTLSGIKNYITSLGHNVVATCNNGINALNIITLHSPDIAILDINMPGMDGLEVLKNIKKQNLTTKTILLTLHKELSIYKTAKDLGVEGYLLKDYVEQELFICLNEINNNTHYISKSLLSDLEYDNIQNTIKEWDKLSLIEKKIIQLIGKQNTSKKIGGMLFISERTVEFHRSNILKKLNLPRNKNALFFWALQHLKSGYELNKTV